MRYAFLLFLSLSFLFTACTDFADLENVSTTESNPEFALPLIDTRVAITDLLDNFDDNSFLTIDDEGLIHFEYTGDVLSRTSEEVFKAVNDAIPPAIPITSPNMALPFSSPDGIDIDQIIFKEGQIQYTFRSLIEEPLTVRVYIPGLEKEGEFFEQTHVVPASDGMEPAVPFPPFTSLDLKDYTLTAEQDSIYIRYDAIKPDGTQDTLSSFLMTLTGLEFAYAEGFLGQQDYDSDRDTIEIDFFENWKRGRVYFEDPSIDISITNSFGIPTRSKVNVFEVITAQGETIPLRSPVIDEEGEGVDFNFPNLNEIGATKTTLFSFTTENSNIDEVLGSTPIALIYDVDAETNPDDGISTKGFVTDSSSFTVNVKIDLPLHGNAENFAASDTFDLSLAGYEDIQSAEFKVITENELGLEVDLQAYFADANGNIIDSLLTVDQILVKGAPVDDNGNAIEKAKTVTFIPFTPERFEKIKDTEKLIVESDFSTINEGTRSVKVFANSGIDFRMGLKVKL